MFKVKVSENKIECGFSSEMHHIDRVIRECQVFFHQLKVAESGFANLKLILREVLNNAVEHGNRLISKKSVTCNIEYLGSRRFKIVARDKGKGFSHRDISWEVPEDPGQVRNRGLTLVNSYSDEIKFNESGNQVTVFLSLSEETTFAVNCEGNSVMIVPSGPLTASVEKALRNLLLALLRKKYLVFRLDFEHVDDIDSVILSVLIVFHKMLRESGDWQLEIIHLDKELQDLFRLTRLDRLYKIIS